MMVSKTVTIDVNDLVRIDEKVKNGEAGNISEFVQKAIKNELKRQ